VLVALPVAAHWRGFGTEPSDVGANASEMVVERLDVPPSRDRINLVLKEKSGARRLVVAVGQLEAGSIVQDADLGYKLDAQVTAYSMTRSIADGLGGKIQRVVVNDANDRSFFAKVVLATENREVAVDAAPSDAIALALRAKAPIYVDVAVLNKAGVASGR
jgi:bifunctional DNase/RNase